MGLSTSRSQKYDTYEASHFVTGLKKFILHSKNITV
jgi:hypothetical protein